MYNQTLRVLAHAKARAGRDSDLRSLLESLVEPTRAEDGCIEYKVWERRDAPGSFTIVESWRDEAALEAHLKTEHLSHAIARFDDLLEVPLELEHLEEVGPGGNR